MTRCRCAALFFLTPTFAHSFGVHAARFENRPLATFGDPRNGWAWLTGLPAWATDSLPFRDGALRATEAVSRDVFGEPASLPGPLSGQPSGPLPAGSAPQPPIAAFPSVIEGRDGWLYLGADVSGACAPSRSLTDTMISLRRLRTAVQASGRQFVLVVAPDKIVRRKGSPVYYPADTHWSQEVVWR